MRDLTRSPQNIFVFFLFSLIFCEYSSASYLPTTTVLPPPVFQYRFNDSLKAMHKKAKVSAWIASGNDDASALGGAVMQIY